MYHLACERMFPAKHLFTGTLHFPLKKLSMLCGCICIYKKRTDPYYVESIVKLFVSHSCIAGDLLDLRVMKSQGLRYCSKFHRHHHDSFFSFLQVLLGFINVGFIF